MKAIIFVVFLSLILGMVLFPVFSIASNPNESAKQEATAPVPVKKVATKPTYKMQWEVPLMPGMQRIKIEDTAAFYEVDQPYENVLAFYRDVLKGYRDPRYAHGDWAKERDWKDQMYIEDQGGAKWHSVGIMKGGGEKTTVKITRDNMTWVFSTLLIRFAGVFFVLCILWLLLSINRFAMKKYFPNEKKS